MELTPRQHAKEAIKLVKRQRGTLKQTKTSDILEVCTSVALGLVKGKLPEWYVAASREQPVSSSVTPSGDEEDDTSNLIDDSESSVSTNSKKSIGLSRTTSRLSSNAEDSNVSISELSSLVSPRSPSAFPRIPSCGLITTRSATASPQGLPPILPPINSGIKCVAMQKPPLIDIKVNPETPSKPKTKEKRKGEQKIKVFPQSRQTEMDVSEITSNYWVIPFDPLRKDVFSDHLICDFRRTDYEEEEETQLNEKDALADVDFWEIQRILRFVRIGNPTATVLALCALKEMDLSKPSCIEIIYQLNGIILFLNILDTKDHRCRVAALKVLVNIASSKKISTLILRKSGIQQLVVILDDNDTLVVSLASDVLSLLAKHSAVRAVANKLEIIPKLMTLFQRCVKANLQGDKLSLCQSVCYCLWSCSKSIREQDVLCVSQSLTVISQLVDSHNEGLVVPLLGLVEKCARVDYFRCKMEKENFIDKVIRKVGNSEHVVQVLCVKILFKCACDRKSQQTLVKSNCLQQLMRLLKGNLLEINDELLVPLLGIVWRCSVNDKHKKKFVDLDMFPLLVDILKSNKSFQAKSAALGVLSEFLWDDCYIQSAVQHKVVYLLMDFLSSTEPSVLVNCARSLGVCARNSSWRGEILKLDGLRLLWSLLKSNNDQVVCSGAVAVASICACCEESATMVRSIVGGVELLMSLLTHTELTKYKVLISLCETAVNIAHDAENRSILIDYGLIPVILRLCGNKNKILRYYVTCLISRCCEVKSEKTTLSKCIPYLVVGLGDEYDEHVHCAAICALSELSRDFSNCAFLRESQTKKIMLNMLGSSNERIQDAAAVCLANVRKSMTSTSYATVQDRTLLNKVK